MRTNMVKIIVAGSQKAVPTTAFLDSLNQQRVTNVMQKNLSMNKKDFVVRTVK